MKGKLFIVEDQPHFRKGLLKLAAKRSEEWTVIGEAGNGRDALTRMEDEIPDLLLTDIRMPFLDGLGVVEEVRRRGWETSVVIITGFKDFTYAQTAVKFGVLDFLTKPCVEADVLAVLDQAYRKLVQAKQAGRRAENWRRQHEDHELRSGILGLSCNCTEVKALLTTDLLGMTLYFVSIPTYLTPEKEYGEQDILLLQFAVMNILEEHLQAHAPEAYRLISLTRSKWALFLGPTRAEAAEQGALLPQLAESVKQYLKLDLEWQEQAPCLTKKALHAAYVNYVNNAAPKPEEPASQHNAALLNQTALRDKEGEVLAWLMAGDSGWLAQTLREQVKRMQGLGHAQAKIEALLLATALYRVAQMQFPEWAAEQGVVEWNSVYRCVTSEDTVAWLKEFIDRFLDGYSRFLASKNGNPVVQATRFIEENYMQECGLAEVAAHVHLNPSYFSSLFKKETGESVTGYVLKLRMQKAKLLLKSTDMRIFEISEAIGFNDSNYFTNTFNKMTGLSPKEFRKQEMKGEGG